LKHVGFKTFFGLLFAAATWFVWTVMWLFGSVLPNYTAWDWPELISNVATYLFITAVLVLVIPVIMFIAHALHRLFWRAEDTYMPPPEEK